MATFVDISILQNFSSVFTFILVFVIIYATLETTKALGAEKKSLNALIAMIMGFLVSMSSGVVSVIQNFTPWFTMLIIIIFFILFAVKLFGVSDSKITSTFEGKSSILTWILILTAVILLFSLGSGFGQKTLEEGQGSSDTSGTTVSVATGNTTTATDTGSFNQNLYNTLYHPKVLGLILIMLIVVIAMLFLTDADKLT